MPFDPYFKSEAAKEVESSHLVVLPDPVPEPAPAPDAHKPQKKTVKHYGKFQRLSRGTLSKARSDIARCVILWALSKGNWQFEAIHALINEFAKDEDIPNFNLSKQSLGQILSYKPKGWKFQDGIVSKDNHYSCKGSTRTVNLAVISFVLDDLIRQKKVRRAGSNRFAHVPDTPGPRA